MWHFYFHFFHSPIQWGTLPLNLHLAIVNMSSRSNPCRFFLLLNCCFFFLHFASNIVFGICRNPLLLEPFSLFCIYCFFLNGCFSCSSFLHRLFHEFNCVLFTFGFNWLLWVFIFLIWICMFFWASCFHLDLHWFLISHFFLPLSIFDNFWWPTHLHCFHFWCWWSIFICSYF